MGPLIIIFFSEARPNLDIMLVRSYLSKVDHSLQQPVAVADDKEREFWLSKLNVTDDEDDYIVGFRVY